MPGQAGRLAGALVWAEAHFMQHFSNCCQHKNLQYSGKKTKKTTTKKKKCRTNSNNKKSTLKHVQESLPETESLVTRYTCIQIVAAAAPIDDLTRFGILWVQLDAWKFVTWLPAWPNRQRQFQEYKLPSPAQAGVQHTHLTFAYLTFLKCG